MKKIVAIVAVIAAICSLSAPAFALEPNNYAEVEFNPTNAYAEEVVPYGAKAPTQEYNLNGASYSVDGNFKTTIYTAYYFAPNARGELSFNLDFTWTSQSAVQKAATVHLYSTSSNKEIQSWEYFMEENADGNYGPVVSTGVKKITNLDPSQKYYFWFTKTTDSQLVDVTGEIWA